MLAIAASLIKWGKANGRCPPWRRTRDAYKLGVAEILLQKTKGEDAEPVWRRVVSAYPGACELAASTDEDLRSLIAGLGLGYQRTQRLKAMAHWICARGATGKIPGLGPYGSAILALAQGHECNNPPVDGNIARLVCRFLDLSFERGEPRKKPAVKRFVAALLDTQPSPNLKLQLVYALIDLGATLRGPDCPAPAICRLLSAYKAGAEG